MNKINIKEELAVQAAATIEENNNSIKLPPYFTGFVDGGHPSIPLRADA